MFLRYSSTYTIWGLPLNLNISKAVQACHLILLTDCVLLNQAGVWNALLCGNGFSATTVHQLKQ